MKDEELLKDLFNTLTDFKENGTFFISAIELDMFYDGEEFEKKLDKLLERIKKEIL